MTDPSEIEKLVAEVAGSNFSENRLNLRLGAIVSTLAKNPSLSLPEAFDSAGLEGAYRFFGNHRVTPTEILSKHYEATRARSEGEGDFLIAHDSTSFSYRYDGNRAGLGRIQRVSARSNQTFSAHVSLAISADGSRRPLGVSGFHTWTRGPERNGAEYQRWEAQIRASSVQLGGLKHAIHLADREADDYEMFCALQRDGHRFVMRCLHNRLLAEAEGRKKLHEALAEIDTSVEREARLTRRTERKTKILQERHPTRGARTAKLRVAATTVALKRPSARRLTPSTDLPESLSINVVRVWEPEPPPGEEPVEWYLYTTDPIDTPEQQLKIVDYYRARWVIEEYFKAIKTGCDFESRQLQDYEGLINLLAIFAPIAYHLLLIRSESRRAPEQTALSVISEEKLDVLRALGRRPLSDAPTTRDVYLAIAALGGHIKYAPDPGWLTLARGYEKLETLTEGWRAAKLQLGSDQR
jgi:Transposase DNA-binding/Transposase DDE domain